MPFLDSASQNTPARMGKQAETKEKLRRPPSPFKPINVLDVRSVRPERLAVVDGLQELISLARPARPVEINDYGHYRAPNWRDEDGNLRPHLSVDWYVLNAWDRARQQVNAAALMASLVHEPWRKKELLGEHYDLMIIDQPLFHEDAEGRRSEVITVAQFSFGAVISMCKFSDLRFDPYGILKSATIHTMGHVFGIPRLNAERVDRREGIHCTNPCTMRYVASDVTAWAQITEDRLQYGPLCDDCVHDLRRLFSEGGE